MKRFVLLCGSAAAAETVNSTQHLVALSRLVLTQGIVFTSPQSEQAVFFPFLATPLFGPARW